MVLGTVAWFAQSVGVLGPDAPATAVIVRPMRTPTATITAQTRDRSTDGLIAVGVSGCMLALVVGAAAATDHGVLIASGIVGLALCGLVVAIYVHDPVLALICLWLFVVFNAPLSAVVGYTSSAGAAVRQANEIFVVLFAVLTAWRTMRTKTQMPPLRFILPGIGVALCGLLGGALHGVPLTITVLGAWLALKLWIMVVITLLLPWRTSDASRVYTVLTRVGLFVSILGFADYFTHGAASHALHTSNYHAEAGGFRGEAIHSIFPVPGEYSLFMSLLFALTFARFAVKRSRSDLVLGLLFAVSIVLSLRLKGFLSLAAVVAIVGLAQGVGNNRRGIIILLAGALLCVGAYRLEGAVIAKQVSKYTSSGTTARVRLYSTGEQIAVNNFPLGVGFGRFGSYTSRIYYSPIYYQYDLASVFGLARANPKFIDDTSWPSVMGETGYGGFAIFLVGVILLILAVIRQLRTAAAGIKWVPVAALCVIAVLLVTSVGQGSLFDWLAITTVVMMLGPALIATRDPVPSGSRPVRLEGDSGHRPTE